MRILLCDRINQKYNQYIELLAEAYQKNNHNVIFDVQNFLFSSFLPDVVHIQWPEAIYSWRFELPHDNNTLTLLKKRLDFYTKNDVPIVYTVHNILPHDSVGEFEKQFFENILKASNIIVHHGSASKNILINKWPYLKKCEHIICPHGPYPQIIREPDLGRRKYRLPFSKYVYLNFGIQKNYKGYEFNKNIFRNLSDKEIFLFTIGQKIVNSNRSRYIDHMKLLIINFLSLHNIYSSKNAKSVFTFVSQNEIPITIGASDVIFLGHQKGLNSGLLSLAASYGKPVVFPELGNFEEQLRGWPWYEYYKPGSINSAIDAIRRMHDRIKAYKPGSVRFDNTEWLTINSWDIHVKNITDAARKWTQKANRTVNQ